MIFNIVCVASFGQAEDYSLVVSGSAAVSNANKAQAKVYPNPVVDVLNVESASKVISLSVYDLSGKAVSSHTLNAVKSQVNLSKLAPGVYIVNIETENGTQSVKIVKK
ncbi:MAG: T9SS type A sorting domain-containing protein [Flavobacteriales bacterium]|nr:T9SS type A sorting domain-containing protein [Flavobacteriales bacterium]MCA0391629.1 T9SS type A sorting domain-containing protein [Bacteroidota bacterium]